MIRSALVVALAVGAFGCKEEPAKNPTIHSDKPVAKGDTAPAADASPWQGLEPGAAPEVGATVWAAAADERGHWAINRFTVTARAGGSWLVRRRVTRNAPQALLRPLNREVPGKGSGVLFGSDRAEFGVAVGDKQGRVTVETVTFGGGVVRKDMAVDEVLPVTGDASGFGAPAVFTNANNETRFGIVVGQGEGKVHLVVGVGKSSPMVKIEAGKVRLIEHDELLQRGKKVWFRRSTTGHADGRLDSGIVQYAVGKSGYAVKGSDGTIYKVPWAFVAPT